MSTHSDSTVDQSTHNSPSVSSGSRISDVDSSLPRIINTLTEKKPSLADSQPSSLLTQTFSGISPVETDSNDEMEDKTPQDESTQSLIPGNEAVTVKLAASTASSMSSVTSPGNPSREARAISDGQFPSSMLIAKTLSILKSRLPAPWISVADKSGFHTFQLSGGKVKTVQRQIFISFEKEEDIIVHSKSFRRAKRLLSSVSPAPVKLLENTIDSFCVRIYNIIEALNQYKICPGVDFRDQKEMWNLVSDGAVEKLHLQDGSFGGTYRPSSCEKLIDRKEGEPCCSCSEVRKYLVEKSLFSSSVRAKPLNKRKRKEEEKVLQGMKEQVRHLLVGQGVDIDSELHKDFSSILDGVTLKPFQKVFLEEQAQSISWSNMDYMWHPVMLRLAISIRLSCGHKALKNSWVVKLPSSRTLCDYSRPFHPEKILVSCEVLDILNAKVKDLEPHQKFVSLFLDEVIITRNLVFRESDKILVGFVHLEEVEEEMARLERCVLGEENWKPHDFRLTYAFTVKGILADLKCVVAVYENGHLPNVFLKTCDVISRLEVAEVKVLIVIAPSCKDDDGYMSKHSSRAKTLAGDVCYTLNLGIHGRPIFFVANAHHIVGAIYNCLQKGHLELDGEKVMVSVIHRLHAEYKESNNQKSFKIDALGAFPNCSTSRYAARVFNEKVASDIERMEWPETRHMVKFIRVVSRFFECLNGAGSLERSRGNTDLAPYTNPRDPRLNWLSTECVRFFERWRDQVDALPIPSEEREKKTICLRTRKSIEITAKGFVAACKFLFAEAARGCQEISINARAFSQDD